MTRKNFIKKHLIPVLVLTLLFAQMIPVRAEASVKFSEHAETKDNAVFYEIEITPDSNVCGLSLEIEYPEKQVRLKECTISGVLDGGIAKNNCDIQGKVLFSYITLTPLKEGGSLLLVEFEALSTDNKDIDIDCNVTECIDQECNEIAYTYIDAEISNPQYVEPTSNKIDDEPDDVTENDHGHQTEEDGSGDGDHKADTDNSDPGKNKPASDDSVSKENVPDETTVPKTPADPQDSSTAGDPTNNQQETVPGETTLTTGSQEDPPKPPTNSGEDETVSMNAENSKAEEDKTPQDHDDPGEDVDRGPEHNPTWWLMIVGGIGLAAVLTAICFVAVRPTLLKRRSGNEK